MDPKLKEDEIRPDHLMEEVWRLYELDVKRLFSHYDTFLPGPCPACGAEEHTLKWLKNGFRYAECSTCETVYLNPRPTPELLKEYYATSESYVYWRDHVCMTSEGVRSERIAKPRLERIFEICARDGPQPEVILEVGAGFGSFADIARKSGRFRRVIAVEPTPVLADHCKMRGLETIAKPIEEVTVEEASTDVVAAFEVIEHLLDPASFLTDCTSLLTPGGLVVLTCPNVKGFDVMTLGTLSATVCPDHLNYFHPAAMSLLFDRCGLEMVELSTPGQLDTEIVRKQALSGVLDISENPFLTLVLIEQWDRLGSPFQSFLADNGLSSHMWVVARKP